MLSKWVFLLLVTVVMSELSGDAEIRKNHRHVSPRRCFLRSSSLDFIGRWFEAINILDRPGQPWSWNRSDSLESSRTWAVCCFKYVQDYYCRNLINEILQQYNETTSAFGRIKDILNDQFSDTATKGVGRSKQLRSFNWSFIFLSSLSSSNQPPSPERRQQKNTEFHVPSLVKLSTEILEACRSSWGLNLLMLKMWDAIHIFDRF